MRTRFVILVAALIGSVALPPRETAMASPDPTFDLEPAAQAWITAGQSITDQIPPDTWCGTVTSADNTLTEVYNGIYKWHVVIAVPQDVTTYIDYNPPELLNRSYKSVRAIELFHSTRIGVSFGTGSPWGWKTRFDYGTSCGPSYPDISFKVLPKTQAQYGSTPWNVLIGDLQAAGYSSPTKNYLIHYVGSSNWCGAAVIRDPMIYQGGYFAINYNVPASGAIPEQGCRGQWPVDAHEMGHAMGAAVGGPLNNDGGHVFDCTNDTMSQSQGATCGPQPPLPTQTFFDWNHDNYFAHSGAWWDTEDSPFWCKPACV